MHALEYKSTKARKWQFHSMSGDLALMERLATELKAAGWQTRIQWREMG